jgi:transposase
MGTNYGLLLMSHQELGRIKVIEDVLAGRLSQILAGKKLDISVRQVSRLVKKYAQDGPPGLLSKRRGARGNRGFSPSFKSLVMERVKEKYSDFGPTFAAEKLLEHEQLKVNKETLRGWMIEAGLRAANPKKEKRVYQQRQRRPRFGELIQIDGSFHDWFEGRSETCCAIVFIDDATSKIVAIHFTPRETTVAYFTAATSYFNRYGRPLAFYSDKHNIFRVNIPEAVSGTGKTQFGRAMQDLDIELICAHSPQAKGRVERANGTLQDRLIKELRLANISTIEAANAFVPSFIEKHNQRFAKPPALAEDANRQELPEPEILSLIFSHQEERILSKNLELSYQNTIYQIKKKTSSYAMRKASVTVCEHIDGKISILYKGHQLEFEIFDKTNQPAEIVSVKDINQKVNSIIKNTKQPRNHPWRKQYLSAPRADKSRVNHYIP